jgi:O-antigen/teichoic acid export membrane protein
MRGLWATVLQTSGAKVYSIIVGMMMLTLTARYLGPEGRGQVAVLSTWASLFATFMGLSLGQAAIFRLTNAATRMRLQVILRALIVFFSALSLCAMLLAYLMYLFAPVPASVRAVPLAAFIAVVTIPFLIWEQYGSSLLIALDRVNVYNVAQIVGRTFAIAALLLFLFAFNWGVVGAVASVLVGQIVVAICSLPTILRSNERSQISTEQALLGSKEMIKDALKLHFNAIGTFLFASTGVLIIDYHHGASKAAFFQLAVQLIGVLCVIPQAVSMTISAKVTTLGPDGAWPSHRKIMIQTMVLMSVIISIAYMMAPMAIVLVGGEGFSSAVELFRALLPGVFGVALSQMMAPQWIGRGYFWQAAAVTFLIGIVSVVISIPLVAKYETLGAVFGYLATYFLSVLFNGIMYMHCANSQRKQKTS